MCSLLQRVFNGSEATSLDQANHAFEEIIETVFHNLEQEIMAGNKEAIRTITKQIKALQKENIGDQKTITTAGKALTEMYQSQRDPKSTIKALRIYIRSQVPPGQLKKFDALAAKYITLFNATKESKDPQSSWRVIEAFKMASEFLLDPAKKLEFEQHGILLLNAVMTGKDEGSSSKSLNTEEAQQLEAFLFYAYNNLELNSILKAKTETTKAEKFLIEFSFKSSLIQTYKGISKVLQNNFSAMHFDDIKAKYNELIKAFNKPAGQLGLHIKEMKEHATDALKSKEEKYEIQSYQKFIECANNFLKVCSQYESVLPSSRASLEDFEYQFRTALQRLSYANNELLLIHEPKEGEASLDEDFRTLSKWVNECFLPSIEKVKENQHNLQQFQY